MNIDDALKALCERHQFDRLDIGFRPASGELPDEFISTVWGEGIGAHGCTSSNAETASEAISAVILKAQKLRAETAFTPEIELEIEA